MLLAHEIALVSPTGPAGLSPYLAMDNLWDGAGLVNVGGFATAWNPAVAGFALSVTTPSSVTYVASWRNGKSAMRSLGGALNAGGSFSPVGGVFTWALAGEFPVNAGIVSTYAFLANMATGRPYPLYVVDKGSGLIDVATAAGPGNDVYFLTNTNAVQGKPFFAVVRQQAAGYRMALRCNGTSTLFTGTGATGASPGVSGTLNVGSGLPSGNHWAAPVSLFAQKSGALTDAEMLSMCDWSIGEFNL